MMMIQAIKRRSFYSGLFFVTFIASSSVITNYMKLFQKRISNGLRLASSLDDYQNPNFQITSTSTTNDASAKTTTANASRKNNSSSSPSSFISGPLSHGQQNTITTNGVEETTTTTGNSNNSPSDDDAAPDSSLIGDHLSKFLPSSAPSSSTSSASRLSIEDDGSGTIYGKYYIGCYLNKTVDHVMSPSSKVAGDNFNIPDCLSHCSNEGYEYAGFQNGSDCYCGNTFNGHGSMPNDDCNMDCSSSASASTSGSDTHKCGGVYRLDIYRFDKEQRPILIQNHHQDNEKEGNDNNTTSSVAAAAETVASNPVVLEQPSSADTASTTTTAVAAPPPPPPRPLTGSHLSNYIGCFLDKKEDRFMSRISLQRHLSISDCKSQCFMEGYPYTGLQNGRECYCGNSYDRHGQTSQKECNMDCIRGPGKCGGAYRMDVYLSGVSENFPTKTTTPTTTTTTSHDDGKLQQHHQQRRITMVVPLSGELGNNLFHLFNAYAMKLHVEDQLPNVTIHLVGEHQDVPKWTRPAADIKKCFPKLRDFDFSSGRWSARDSEFPQRQKSQNTWLWKNGYTDSVVDVDNNPRNTIQMLQRFLEQQEQEPNKADIQEPDDSHISLPYLRVHKMGLDVDLLEKYRAKIQQWFAFDREACCGVLPDPDEVVFHFRNFAAEGRPGWLVNRKGFVEVGANHIVPLLLENMPPDTSKVAFITRHYKDNPNAADPHINAMANSGKFQLRLIPEQTGVEDFCILLHAKHVVATRLSSYAVSAGMLGNQTTLTTYSVNATASRTHKAGLFEPHGWKGDKDPTLKNRFRHVNVPEEYMN